MHINITLFSDSHVYILKSYVLIMQYKSRSIQFVKISKSQN